MYLRGSLSTFSLLGLLCHETVSSPPSVLSLLPCLVRSLNLLLSVLLLSLLLLSLLLPLGLPSWSLPNLCLLSSRLLSHCIGPLPHLLPSSLLPLLLSLLI